MRLRIHRFLPVTTVEGPGKRACLWVQGCSIQCRGCGVPWTWNSKGGSDTTVIEMFSQIKESLQKNDIEGVTFLGGEPFDQAEALAELAALVKSIGLSVMCFSGYTYETLLQGHKPGSDTLLSLTDLLIDGPFVQEQLDLSRPWVGSSNQNYRFLTDRYSFLEDQLHSIPNKLEIRIERNGVVAVNGMATQNDLRQLTTGFGHRQKGRNEWL
ncbi:4Fe-4S single cluster domain-containing protein [Fictibacillus aquaticus]|uniref:Ribonucleoside-triphosphate reductase activating protein n=1 Tax=Fictibacillus aquaticus TaxID=2021314 RepID=A0A235F8C8_9BACL|nr:4Fe-4S single cluster domain-containing protein [Fictibacillus aquaticus]OYD57556.1 ribonucleoside-triphosphate reductase activating protein [Fictibacillus aquaticus]